MDTMEPKSGVIDEEPERQAEGVNEEEEVFAEGEMGETEIDLEEPKYVDWRQQLRHSKLPIIVWTVIITTFIACAFSGSAFIFYSVGGYAWVVALIVGALTIIINFSRITFPVYIWLPWILFVAGTGYLSTFPNAQRSIMLICPVIVGMAVSTAHIDQKQLKNFSLLLKVFSVGLVFMTFILTGLLITGVLPDTTALAPQAITASLLLVFFAASYALEHPTDLFWWMGMVSVPIMAMTRMAILVSGLTLPVTLAPLKVWVRMLIIGILCFGGVILFYSPRVQSKMFVSGKGQFADLLNEKKLATSGRSAMAKVFAVKIYQQPLLGYGANGSEVLCLAISNGQLTHPHNDYIRIMYDYGFVGLGIFLLTNLWQLAHLLKRSRRSDSDAQLMFLASASSFLPFFLMMLTDNVILYAAFFGNLQFTLIGLAYAELKYSRIEIHSYESDEFFENLPRTTRSLTYREDSDTESLARDSDVPEVQEEERSTGQIEDNEDEFQAN
jgi:O-antigen ligase